mmetsp:Transcript_4309/g.9559  ORF Transcript_4309/g.9559 Transcript_4309/m.9559 type:complete len:86 (-) Transcript_4309:545-802(-)
MQGSSVGAKRRRLTKNMVDAYVGRIPWIGSNLGELVHRNKSLSNRLWIILPVLCVGGGIEWFPFMKANLAELISQSVKEMNECLS